MPPPHSFATAHLPEERRRIISPASEFSLAPLRKLNLRVMTP